jgi:hypothetical protein
MPEPSGWLHGKVVHCSVFSWETLFWIKSCWVSKCWLWIHNFWSTYICSDVPIDMKICSVIFHALVCSLTVLL